MRAKQVSERMQREKEEPKSGSETVEEDEEEYRLALPDEG